MGAELRLSFRNHKITMNEPIQPPPNGGIEPPVTELQKPDLLQLKAQVYSPILPQFNIANDTVIVVSRSRVSPQQIKELLS